MNTKFIEISIKPVSFFNGKKALLEAHAVILEEIMKQCKWNQVKAAARMGVSRGTLRKQLKDLFGDKYINKNTKSSYPSSNYGIKLSDYDNREYDCDL